MTMTDPIADMLTRLRNANSAYHDKVVMPHSKLKANIAEILKREGSIASYRDEQGDVAKTSTSGGLMTDRQANKSGVGGEVLAYVW
jgi:small subunit ribosomal protein S8